MYIYIYIFTYIFICICVCVCVYVRVCVCVSYNGCRQTFRAFFVMRVFNTIPQLFFDTRKTLSFEQTTAKSL